MSTLHRVWQRSLPVLRLAVPVALLAALWTVADGASALARIRNVDPGWLAFAFVLANLQIVFCAIRWRAVAAKLGVTISSRHAIGEYYLAQLVNMTLPGGVLGDAGRAMRSRSEAGLGRATQAVVIERLSGQAALLSVTLGGFAWAVAEDALPIPGIPSGAIAGALGVAAAFAALWALLPRLRRGAGAFGAAARHAVISDGAWRLQLPLSLAVVACNLLSFAACAWAIGAPLPAIGVLTIVPLILTAMVLPVSLGGWGVRESAAAALFPLVGAGLDATAGLAASLVFGVVILLASLPGALWPWFSGKKGTAPRKPPASPVKPAARRHPIEEGAR